MTWKETRTKTTASLPKAITSKPRLTEEEIIEEILRAAGLESLG